MFLYSLCLQCTRVERVSMGHYKRKPYKRKLIDDSFENNPLEKFIEESYLELYEPGETDLLFTIEEPFLEGEPDIVKQLRFEELQGKLSMPSTGSDTMNIDLDMPKTSNHKDQHYEPVVKDYNAALALAKKALQEVELKEK